MRHARTGLVVEILPSCQCCILVSPALAPTATELKPNCARFDPGDASPGPAERVAPRRGGGGAGGGHHGEPAEQRAELAGRPAGAGRRVGPKAPGFGVQAVGVPWGEDDVFFFRGSPGLRHSASFAMQMLLLVKVRLSCWSESQDSRWSATRQTFNFVSLALQDVSAG